jgi:hypothetical protein
MDWLLCCRYCHYYYYHYLAENAVVVGVCLLCSLALHIFSFELFT